MNSTALPCFPAKPSTPQKTAPYARGLRPRLATRVAAAAEESDQRVALVKEQLAQVKLAGKIRNGEWFGGTGKAISDVVNMVLAAGLPKRPAGVAEFAHPALAALFSNVDGAEIHLHP